MSRPTTWGPRISQITAFLEADNAEYYVRTEVQRIFGIGPSQAKELMTAAGARALYRELTVSRDNLIKYVNNSDEARRARRFAGQLTSMGREAAARKIPIEVRPGDKWIRFQDLAAVSFDAGVLTIRFESEDDLLRKLMLLAQAAANEPDRFRELCEKVAVG